MAAGRADESGAVDPPDSKFPRWRDYFGAIAPVGAPSPSALPLKKLSA